MTSRLVRVSWSLVIFLATAVTAGACALLDNQQSEQIAVFPPVGTDVAHPDTQISFRGETAEGQADIDAGIGDLTVQGSQSGDIAGDLRRHPDGSGVTFSPAQPLSSGEEIVVGSSALDGQYVFTVADIPDAPDGDDGKSSSAEEDRPEPQRLQTFPDALPPLVQTTGDIGDGPFFLTPASRGEVANGALIVDSDGQPLWWRPSPDPKLTVGNMSYGELQGEPVIMWFEGTDPYGTGRYQGEWIVMDSSYSEVARITGGNGIAPDIHDIALTDRGTAWLVAYLPVAVDLTAYDGPKEGIVLDAVVQEIDINTGDVYFEWHSLDHIPIDATVVAKPATEEVVDYAHINSLDEGPDGDVVISLRNTSQVINIDRDSGEVAWILSSDNGTLDLDDDPGPSLQHHARWLPDGTLSVFDNGNGHDPQTSRAVVYDIDADNGSATVVRSYDDNRFTPTQGSLQTLADGSALATWTEANTVTRFNRTGSATGRMDTGVWSYRVSQEDWVATPAEPPTLTHNDGALFALWNGATEVASWEVLAGASRDDLATVDDVPRDGFETGIEVPVDQSVVQVRARDNAGNELGRSSVVLLDEP